MTSQPDNANPMTTDREPKQDEPELPEGYAIPEKPKIVAEQELDEVPADQDA